MSAWSTQRAERLGSDVELTSDPLLTWPWRSPLVSVAENTSEPARSRTSRGIAWRVVCPAWLHPFQGLEPPQDPGAIQSRATVSTHHEGEAKSAPRCRT